MATVKRTDHASGDDFLVFGDPKSQAVTLCDDTGAAISGGPATQTTLADILAKIGLLAKLTDTQPISQQPQTSDGNNFAFLNSTGNSVVTVTTTTGSFVVTSAGLFTSADVGKGISGSGIPANAIITDFTSSSSVTFKTPPTVSNPHGSPATASGSISATLQDGFAGTYSTTRADGVVRELVVLALSLADGTSFPSDLGGTFAFQYSEDAATASITEVRAIDDFASVRDFDLINAGAYFRVMFAPSRDLTANESIAIVTTLRNHFDGAFVRLANQEIEEANAAMSQQFAYQKNFNAFTGKSENVRADSYVPAFSSSTPLGAAGTFDTGIVDCSTFNYVATELESDVGGSLQAFFYADAAGTTLLRTFTRPYTAGEGFALFGSILSRPYVRYVYTNGATPQAQFHIATKVFKSNLSGQILGLSDFIPSNILTQVIRSVIVGRDPDGKYTNIGSSRAGGIHISAAKLATYFASFRGVANPFTLSISPTVVTPARVATLYHTGASTKTVKLRKIDIHIAAVSGGTNTLNFALHRTTTAPTGGTTITPAKSETSDAAAEAVCVAQPTVPGTLGDPFMSFAVELTNSSRNVSFTLYDMTSVVPDKSPQLRAGVLEGLALQVTTTGTPVVTGIVNMVFTEE